MHFMNNMQLNYFATIFVVLLLGVMTRGEEGGWRTDSKYEPWTMKGAFIHGTPPTCEKAPAPANGRWVCSYGNGDNGRSLCLVDCQKDFVIHGKPLIFNCENGAWELFPIPEPVIGVPWGRCVPIEYFAAQFSDNNDKRIKTADFI